MTEESPDAILRDAREWVALARSGALPDVDFREAEIAKIVAHLDRSRSVMLVGPAAVGKTTVLAGVARALAERSAARPIFEFSTSDILVGTRYLGEWQTRLLNISQAIMQTGGALLITAIANLPHVGRHDKGDENLFDALRPLLERVALPGLGEFTYEAWKLLQRIPGFARAFELVDIAPMSEPEVEQVIARAAARRKVELPVECRETLVRLTSRFAAARPQPGLALALLEQVADYRDQKQTIGEVE